MKLYFDCGNGISGDMAVAALLDLGADRLKMEEAFQSLELENEFLYDIKQVQVNAISATDFDVILKNDKTHHHRNLKDINEIIAKAKVSEKARTLAKKIFQIVAEAEAKVHKLPVDEVHFHEVGAIDSIADILGFAVLYDDLNPEKVYFSSLTEGQGSVMCQHGQLSVPVPAVCEIVKSFQIPIRITENDGEMITPTGAAIVAALYSPEKLTTDFVINKTGYGAGKRKYPNPVLRVMDIEER
ncbi:MAG: LarC family nickel insertion protein [Candidatus Gastranaerophilales bacterium]|nr:LarC family nickel insertion protein [Candidatus Gastranaerophilales bacterium]